MSGEVRYTSSPYLGETTRGVPYPVFFSEHAPIFNNQPGVTLVTGRPGQGKTFLLKTLVTMSSILEKKVIALDPKGDFLSLELMRDEMGEVDFWALSSKSSRGMLDPFRMAHGLSEQVQLVDSTVEMLTGHRPKNHTRLLAIIEDVAKSRAPSLVTVSEKLSFSEDQDLRNVGKELELMSKAPLAQLCFYPGGSRQRQVSFTRGTTVVTMEGLNLPERGRDGALDEQMEPSQRLSLVVMSLIANYVSNVMTSDSSGTPKSLVIDETWAIMASAVGAACINKAARLGRSRNLAMILATQSNRDLDIPNAKFDDMIANQFAFNTRNELEARKILQSMRLPLTDEFLNLFGDLEQGECLFKDFRERAATMHVVVPPTWAANFNTNPMDAMRARVARQRQQGARRS